MIHRIVQDAFQDDAGELLTTLETFGWCGGTDTFYHSFYNQAKLCTMGALRSPKASKCTFLRDE